MERFTQGVGVLDAMIAKGQRLVDFYPTWDNMAGAMTGWPILDESAKPNSE